MTHVTIWGIRSDVYPTDDEYYHIHFVFKHMNMCTHGVEQLAVSSHVYKVYLPANDMKEVMLNI